MIRGRYQHSIPRMRHHKTTCDLNGGQFQVEHVENERAEDGKRRQYGEHIQGCVPRLTTEFFLGQVGGKGGEAGHCADRVDDRKQGQ